MFKIFLFVLIIIGEGLTGKLKSPEEEFEALYKGVKQFIEEEKNKSVNGFENAVKKLTETVRKETESKRKGLEGVFDLALNDLSSMPDVCAPVQLKHQVMVLKSKSLGDFFHCPKLLTGLADIGAIITNTVKLVFELVRTASDFMTGFSKCNSWKPWVAVPCYYEHAKKIVDDVTTSVKMIKEYEKTVNELGHNISQIIAYCRNSSAVENSVTKLMASAYICANKPMPIELYKIH